MNVTESGMQIRFKADPKNAENSIRVNCESDSNVMTSSDLHNERQESPRISTDFGMSIRFKADSENA
jgi:hypothetical protein